LYKTNAVRAASRYWGPAVLALLIGIQFLTGGFAVGFALAVTGIAGWLIVSLMQGKGQRRWALIRRLEGRFAFIRRLEGRLGGRLRRGCRPDVPAGPAPWRKARPVILVRRTNSRMRQTGVRQSSLQFPPSSKRRTGAPEMSDDEYLRLKPRSTDVTEGAQRAPARAMLRAVGMRDDDCRKP